MRDLVQTRPVSQRIWDRERNGEEHEKVMTAVYVKEWENLSRGFGGLASRRKVLFVRA